MKCPIIKKCGGCFYPQDQYQEELKEKTLFIEKEIKKTKFQLIIKKMLLKKQNTKIADLILYLFLEYVVV